MSDYVDDRSEQPIANGDNASQAFSREASCCRGSSSCQPSPVDSAFVGQNGDIQIVNNANSYQSYGAGWNGGYYNRPSVPHVINDVINQNHSYQPYGGGHGGGFNGGHNYRPSLLHTNVGHGSRRHR